MESSTNGPKVAKVRIQVRKGIDGVSSFTLQKSKA